MEIFNEKFPISPGLFRVIRILRLGRLLRFLESAKGIRKLLFTIIKSAPALRNIGTLLFLITFIYATIGMNLYKKLKYTAYINPASNFETFISSFCLLFRIATAAGWNGVLDSAMASDDVPKNISIIFFCSYIILMNLIIINMYIAVILENFNQANLQDDAGITEDDLEAFYVVWEKFDPKATQFIEYSMLSDFMDALDPPLRVPKPNYFFLEKADIPIKPNDVCHCLDIMKAVIKRSLGDPELSQAEGSCDDIAGVSVQEQRKNLQSVLAKVEQRYDVVFPLRKKESDVGTTKSRLRLENTAAKTIQVFFRKHLLLERIDLLSNSHNMSQRAREKNVVAVEHLVTNLWKRREDILIECDEKESSGVAEIEETENGHVANYDFNEISTKPNEM